MAVDGVAAPANAGLLLAHEGGKGALPGVLDAQQELLAQRLEQRLAMMQQELLERIGCWRSVRESWLQEGPVDIGTELLLKGTASAAPVGASQGLGAAPALGGEASAAWSSGEQEATAAPAVVSAGAEARGDAEVKGQWASADTGHGSATPAGITELATSISQVVWASEHKESRLRRFVSSSKFETFFGVAIVAHAVFLGVQTETATRPLSTSTVWALECVSIAFALLFAVELALKIQVHRLGFLVDREMWRWNLLDLVTVASSFFEIIATMAIGPETQGSSIESSIEPIRILRIARITRLLRVIRIVRIIRFVRALRTMVYQLLSTAKPLFWAGVLLFIIMYVFAIVFVQVTLVHKSTGGEMTQKLEEYWSNLSSCMYSLLLAVTNGISWVELAVPLSFMGPFPVVLFIAYIAMVQFAVLNILTGVFCQNAIDSAAQDQELIAQSMLANKQMYVQNMQQLFKAFDADDSGSVTISEFMAHLDDESVRLYFESLDLDTSDVGTLFRLLDTADHRELELEEFISGCLRLKGNAKGMDMAKLSYMQRALAKKLACFMERTDHALSRIADTVLAPEAWPGHPRHASV
mmetsp:Transcript_92786/g.267904  ORF Transcript_92786/g.267904 Transcript_92786/m.267904 type:complete len:584 (-) Transcript_92786:59-1810(-)